MTTAEKILQKKTVYKNEMDKIMPAEQSEKLLADNNVDYLNLLSFEGFREVIPIPCYPVSYFVDSEGTILAAPVQGAPADMSKYEEYIDELLEKE